MPLLFTKIKYVLFALLVILYLMLAAYLFKTTRSGTSSRKGNIELTMTVPAGYSTDSIYQEAISSFEKENPDIKVKLITVSGQNYYQKIMVMIAGGTAPDLIWMGQGFNEFASKNVFLDIASLIKEENIDLSLYKQEVLAWYCDEDKIYSLPFGIDLSFLIYNRKLFKEADLPMPKDDWSFDEFLFAAKRLTLRNPRGPALRYGYSGGLEIGIFGASFIDPVTNEVTCNTPEMLDFLKVNIQMANEWKVAPSPEDRQSMTSDVNGLFRQERIAIMPMYTMRMVQAFEVFKDMDFDMTLCPRYKLQSQWASSQAFCIYKDTRHKEIAWKLFKQFQSKQFQMEMSIRSLPARMDFLEEALSQKSGMPENFQVLKKALELMTPVPRVNHLQELTAVFQRFSNLAFAGRLTPGEAMRQCEKEMKRRMESFKKTDME